MTTVLEPPLPRNAQRMIDRLWAEIERVDNPPPSRPGPRNYERWGMTLEQFKAVLADQKWACWICWRTFGERLRPVIDHDHSTGKMRGILCGSCNVALGMVRDDPRVIRRMLKYLRLHAQESE